MKTQRRQKYPKQPELATHQRSINVNYTVPNDRLFIVDSFRVVRQRQIIAESGCTYSHRLTASLHRTKLYKELHTKLK